MDRPGFRMPYGLERRPRMNYDPHGCHALEEKVGSIRLSPLQALVRSRIRGSKNYLTFSCISLRRFSDPSGIWLAISA